MNTIHITGQQANTMPAAVLSKARPTGIFHKPTAMIRATITPASEACQAGRRTTPSRISTVATGKAATRNDRGKLSPIGVSS